MSLVAPTRTQGPCSAKPRTPSEWTSDSHRFFFLVVSKSRTCNSTLFPLSTLHFLTSLGILLHRCHLIRLKERRAVAIKKDDHLQTLHPSFGFSYPCKSQFQLAKDSTLFYQTFGVSFCRELTHKSQPERQSFQIASLRLSSQLKIRVTQNVHRLLEREKLQPRSTIQRWGDRASTSDNSSQQSHLGNSSFNFSEQITFDDVGDGCLKEARNRVGGWSARVRRRKGGLRGEVRGARMERTFRHDFEK